MQTRQGFSVIDADEFKFDPFDKDRPEYKRAFRSAAIGAVVFVILFIVSITIATFNMEAGWFYATDSDIVARWGLVAFILASLFLLFVIFAFVIGHDRYERNKLKAQKDFIRQKEGRLNASGTTVTFHELWTSNNERIDFYHDIATRQSQASFRAAQITALVGFILSIGLGAVTIIFASGTTAVAASVVAVSTAAMSGYIGSTFLKAQAEASTQLRVFFAQPVELARLLSAERLVEQRVAKEDQSEVVASLAAAVLSAPAGGSRDDGGSQ